MEKMIVGYSDSLLDMNNRKKSCPKMEEAMPIAGSPKKLAQDIADGYFMLTPPMLKLYTPGDLKIIVAHTGIVARELRQAVIPLDDVMAIKARNMKLSRLNQAEVVINAYCKKRRIPI